MQTNYLIIPGYGNSEPEHWQTHFEKQLPNCVRVQQKSWDKPICSDWVNAINDAIIPYDPASVVFISHSLGCIAVAYWVKQFNTKIKGAMLVAPADVENPWQDLNLKSFTPIPLIKFPFPSIVIGSTNDHWATQERTRLFAKNWGSKLQFINDAGHINSSSGYGNWEEGLQILKTEF